MRNTIIIALLFDWMSRENKPARVLIFYRPSPLFFCINLFYNDYIINNARVLYMPSVYFSIYFFSVRSRFQVVITYNTREDTEFRAFNVYLYDH